MSMSSRIIISPQERALLGAIQSTESPGYNVMYGHQWSGEDRLFDDFSDHPRKFFDITSGPNKGKRSSAAGAYQFLGSTWDTISGKYGLTDFSPANQDKGAIALAREDYKRRTGRDLTRDLASGDPDILAGVGKALSKTWTSLPSGIEQGQDADRFVSTFSSLLTGERDNQSISHAMASASEQAGQSERDLLASYRDGSTEGEPPLGGAAPPDETDANNKLKDENYTTAGGFTTGRNRFTAAILQGGGARWL